MIGCIFSEERTCALFRAGWRASFRVPAHALVQHAWADVGREDLLLRRQDDFTVTLSASASTWMFFTSLRMRFAARCIRYLSFTR